MDETQPHLVEIVAVLKEITARVTSADTLRQALDDVLQATAQVLPAHFNCGVTVIAQGQPATFASSGPHREVIDEIQFANGEGPCMEAIRTRTMVISDDLSTEPRWPAWTRHARDHDVQAVMSYPFDVDGPMLGGFNIYSTKSDPFVDDSAIIAMLVAEHAGLLLGVRLRQAGLEDLLAQVRTDPSADPSVERAVGIVMAQRGCTPERALHHLHEAAGNLGVGLADVAERLVSTVGTRNET